MIKKFFNFDNTKYLAEFQIVLNYMIKINPNCNYFEKILDYYELEKDFFLKELNKNSNRTSLRESNKEIRSPHEIQDKQYLWLYYSFYFRIDRLNKKGKDEDFVKKIVDFIFKCHYNYLISVDSNPINLIYKLDNLFQALTRCIEILIEFKEIDNDEQNSIYFHSHGDLFVNFIEVVNNKEEIKKYKILNEDKKNYFQYKMSDNSNLRINTTRKLHKTDLIIENTINMYNLYATFLDGDLNLERSEEKRQNDRFNPTIKNFDDEAIQTLKKEINIKNLSKNIPERIEQESEEILSWRDKESEIVENEYKQRLRIRGYSASVTKYNFSSSSKYDIPPKNLLKEYIKYIFESNDEINNMFNAIFLFGVLSAQNFSKTIAILLKNEINIDLDNNTINSKIDKNLFGKTLSKKYFENNEKHVVYKIPELLSLILNKIETNISQLKDDDLMKKTEENYYTYINKKSNNFYKTINIKPKRIHEISFAYLNDLGKEDISAMFCTRIYSKRLTSKLAYATINTKTTHYSEYIKILFNDLEISEILNTYVKKHNLKFKNKKESKLEQKYSGSNFLIKREELQQFFTSIYNLIEVERDKYMRFNYISVYVRFAMSLLAGTRTFLNSANLENISHELKIMRISEKAETKISGLRVIPLCDTILELILYYQEQCLTNNLNINSFYIYKGTSFNLLNVEKKDLFSEFRDELKDFIFNVPINFGRHIFCKYAIETNLPIDHLDAYLGHYSSGLEQLGIFSTLDFPNYSKKIRELTTTLANIYNVKIIK